MLCYSLQILQKSYTFNVTGWKPRDYKIGYNLELVPIEIMTDAKLGDGEVFTLWFFKVDPTTVDYVENWKMDTGGLVLDFTPDGLKYQIRWCTYSTFTDVPDSAALFTKDMNVWRVTLTRDGKYPTILLECNGVEVFNIDLATADCEHYRFDEKWSTPIKGILQYHDNWYYRCEFLGKIITSNIRRYLSILFLTQK